jgi:threonine dehydrogenase-like Zn-dependent dehydrogenase
MRAVCAAGQGRVFVREMPAPTRATEEALIRVAACGVCGSELPHYHSADGEMITGHEAAGVVEEADDAGVVKVGDRVVLLAIPGCGECEACRQGHENYCPNISTKGRPWKPFGHAEQTAIFARHCLPVPEGMSFATAIAVGGCGIGVAWHGIKRLAPEPGEVVPVIGVGPIGLAAVMVLKHLGAAPVAMDVSPYRLAKAQAFGATRGVLSDSPEHAAEFAAELRAAGVSKLVLCTGNFDAATLALTCLAPLGRMLLLAGLHRWPLESWRMIGIGDKSILGSWHFHRAEWPELLAAVAAGLPADQLVTHTFPFARADEAYRAFVGGETGKVVLVP